MPDARKNSPTRDAAQRWKSMRQCAAHLSGHRRMGPRGHDIEGEARIGKRNPRVEGIAKLSLPVGVVPGPCERHGDDGSCANRMVSYLDR